MIARMANPTSVEATSHIDDLSAGVIYCLGRRSFVARFEAAFRQMQMKEPPPASQD
jgi:hypothetical protein